MNVPLLFPQRETVSFSCRRPKDATAVVMVVLLLFIIPAQPTNLASSPGLLTWDVVQAKLQWSVILLVGSGFSIAEAMRVSILPAVSTT